MRNREFSNINVRACVCVTYTNPDMLQCLVCGDSFFGSGVEHVINEGFGFLRYRVPFRRRILETSEGERDREAMINLTSIQNGLAH